MTARKMPPDIYPESGFRLPLPKSDDFDGQEKALFDKRPGPDAHTVRGLHGPGGIRLHSPRMAEHARLLARYIKFESGISGPIRELAILVTAREMDSQFEWAAHEPEALKAGLPQKIIDIVKFRKSVRGLSEVEAVIIQFGRQMFGRKKVAAQTFAAALKIFGRRQLVDLISLMTLYTSTAYLLVAFDMQLDPDQKPLLPVHNQKR